MKGWPQRPAGASNAEEAFRAVYDAHQDAVYRFVFRIVGSRADAEDITQDTFVRCFRSGPLDLHSPRSWLFRVASHLAFNFLRGRRRQESRHTRSGIFALGAQPRSPAEQTASNDERARVRAVLLEVPEKQAEILMLRYAGLSYREVAEAVGIAPASVGTLLARAEEAFERAYRIRTGPDRDAPRSPAPAPVEEHP